MQIAARLNDIVRFYAIVDALAARLGGPRWLSECQGRMPWPARGVYFFYEPGEVRADSGEGPRIVRVGTHALTSGSRTSLWNRLSQHKGTAKTGGGNHRGSIFRLLVGTALMNRDALEYSTWGRGSSAPPAVRDKETELEQKVSATIGQMPFIWLDIPDSPGPSSLRGYIERNAVALLSNYGRAMIDPPSREWLGHACDRPRVRESGLWNQNHVDEVYDPAFLDEFERLVIDMEPMS